MGLRRGRGVERQDVALESLCFATDTTEGIATAVTAEKADGEVGVSLLPLLHQELCKEDEVSSLAGPGRGWGSGRESHMLLPYCHCHCGSCLLPRAKPAAL